jgi:hypothetical protein
MSQSLITTMLAKMTDNGVGLPCFPWVSNSCSLDAVLVSLLKMAIELGDEFFTKTSIGTPLLRQISYNLKKLLGGGTWQGLGVSMLTEFRDTIRNLLLDRQFISDPITISADSSVDILLDTAGLMPGYLIDIIRGSRQKCADCNKAQQHGSDSFYDYRRGINFLISNSPLQKLRNLQDFVDDAVHIPSCDFADNRFPMICTHAERRRWIVVHAKGREQS